MSDLACLGVIAAVAENLALLMPAGPAESDPEAWLVSIAVRWVGPDGSQGRIVLALDRGVAEATAANLLGLPTGEAIPAADVQDACSEMANVIAGNLLPVLYGNDHEFHLHPPQVVAPAPLAGRTVVRLALVEGVIGVSIAGDADNSRILKAVRPPAARA